MTSQSKTIVPPAPRDNRYYFSDGNIVLLVGGVLFKIHSSLLTQESETFRDMFTLPVAQRPYGEPLESKVTIIEGSCDEQPIAIPEVTCVSFQNLLFMFYGRASDPEFVSTMADTAESNKHHSLSRFYHYLDVADLSHRFAATKLEAWALGQLRGISRSFPLLASRTPDVNYQLRALNYARIIQDKKLERQVQDFTEQSYHELIPLYNRSPLSMESAHIFRLAIIFKHPGLQEDYPSLFGFILCIILSQGSHFWLNRTFLSREDRVKLLSTHVHLTPFPVSKLKLDWVDATVTAAHPRGGTADLQVCAQCNLWPAWETWFIQHYSRLQKEQKTPEGGATVLTYLGRNFVNFIQGKNGISGACTENCQERVKRFLDENADRIFALFAEFYKDVE